MTVKPSLLILAAGMGSRYGGLKQIDPVGPSGETILDYSIFDAMRAGFGNLVFVIRRDIEALFRETVGARFEKRLPVEYVFQELEELPPGQAVPARRKKPWGTGHAILMASAIIRGQFGVINADDFYGLNSFCVLANHLNSDPQNYAMTGFVLRNTLSEFGSVARGVCRTTPDNYLETVTEITGIEAQGAALKHDGGSSIIHPLTGNETVSMNMWGFNPTIFGHLQMMFREFLERKGQDEKSEFYIPAAVNNLIHTRQEKCRVLSTPDSWFGITYRQDHQHVVENIRTLIANRSYPKSLWT